MIVVWNRIQNDRPELFGTNDGNLKWKKNYILKQVYRSFKVEASDNGLIKTK